MNLNVLSQLIALVIILSLGIGAIAYFSSKKLT